ncbi:AMP-binding protein [Psychromarinibacter sp. C21-152]|uniref:AMP-binding protein n=1 Tax=Psychromarinibacter sediminicola TaxID=3033385 RepID=A0AAE3NLQ2_9RHOB|nr:AMP-binding protein [Psychromarinibacter sediminicola]MDF0599608.1 AMP-binding protein [Psychromarinibacter sediminicola]
MTRLDDRVAALRRAGRTRRAQGEGLGTLALRRAAADPDRVVVSEAARSVTRGEMLDMALRLGGALLARGLRPGAAVAVQLPNWWEACAINLAAALFGFRLVPLLPIYRAAELGAILPACEVAAIFVPERLGDTAYPSLVAGLPWRPAQVFTVRGSGPQDFAALVREAPAEPQLPDSDDAKIVLFTSGSTGQPKGVLHGHANLDAMIREVATFWEIGAQDTLYVPSPIGHIGGSIYAFEFPWITGCRAVLAERWDPDRAVREIEAEGASFMAGATPFLSGLLTASERAGSRLPTLRRFICGGASVPPELVLRGLDRFENAVVSRAYGSSEVPLVCPGIATRDEAARRADTDGECTAELRLLAPDGTPAAEGEAGEIAVRAPRMLLGYLDPADEEGAFTADGFVRMGDLGQLIEGRFLRITGRIKDIIIRKGENISPLEIENALARHEAVRQSAVVGIPDTERGELVVAFVVPRAGQAFDLAAMTAHLTALGLAKQKFPERLEIVDSLPVTAVGKVKKAELREIAMHGTGTTA